MIIAVMIYGVRTILPPLRSIFHRLHQVPIHIGWRRWTLAFIALVGVLIANAIDGETLLVNGVEINLFGIDAMERDQICQNAEGVDYPCGRAAVMALQKLIQNNQVVCLPFFAVSPTRVIGACEMVVDKVSLPTSPSDFLEEEYRPNSLSRLMVEQGYALTIGYGRELFNDEQRQAQVLRSGVWAGSFEPPALYRSKHP